jgi:hypothetical protein
MVNSISSGGTSAASGGGDVSLTRLINVSHNFYQQAVHLESFVEQTREDFQRLFAGHELLIAEYFIDLENHHIRPREQQLVRLADSVRALDLPWIRNLIQKYEQAKAGKESAGLSNAAAYFASINASAADRLSGLSVTMGNADPLDYDTQIAVAQSIRRMFEALMEQIRAIGDAYHDCAQEHQKVLMKQDYERLMNEIINPRLQEISDVYRAIGAGGSGVTDLDAIDDVIARLRRLGST